MLCGHGHTRCDGCLGCDPCMHAQNDGELGCICHQAKVIPLPLKKRRQRVDLDFARAQLKHSAALAATVANDPRSTTGERDEAKALYLGAAGLAEDLEQREQYWHQADRQPSPGGAA